MMINDKQLVPVEAQRTPSFCSLPGEVIGDIPLRLKMGLAPTFLTDPEFKAVPTEDLIFLVRTRKHIHVCDRSSAIAVLKGVSK
jgi:hypothetical protein